LEEEWNKISQHNNENGQNVIEKCQDEEEYEDDDDEYEVEDSEDEEGDDDDEDEDEDVYGTTEEEEELEEQLKEEKRQKRLKRQKRRNRRNMIKEKSVAFTKEIIKHHDGEEENKSNACSIM